MISAADARKLSEQGLQQMLIEQYETEIKKAAAEGKFEISVNCFLKESVRKAFETYGYKVDECDEGGYTTISW